MNAQNDRQALEAAGRAELYHRALKRGLTPLDGIRAGDRVFISSACAEPVQIIDELTSRAQRGQLDGVTSYMMLGGSSGRLLSGAQRGHDVVAINASAKWAQDFFPWTIHQTAELMRTGELRYDVAAVHSTPPDEHGYLSLGVSVDFAQEAIAQARIVVAEVNPRMPFTMGRSHVHISEIDGLIEVDYPLAEEILPAPSSTGRAVAGHVLEHVPDGATIEIGVGRIMSAVLEAMADKNDIGLHTGLIIEAMADLIESGNITNSRKALDRGISVANQGRGRQRLYDFVHRNPAVHFMPASYTHAPAVLSQLPDFRAINSALQVDLLGRVNAEVRDGRRVSSTGGLGDFARAAATVRGARSIIALAATADGGAISRIVPHLDAGAVTLTADLADIVVTEHGSAVLRGKRPRERAEALIAIADPRHRAQLAEHLAAGTASQ
jgi:4-hydroxybutyrate CoA-transferase